MSKRKCVSTVSEGDSDLGSSPDSAIRARQKKVRWDGEDEFDEDETHLNECENSEEESPVVQKVSPL